MTTQASGRFAKTEDPAFIKDRVTGAVINRDVKSFNKFKEERNRILEQQRLANEVNQLKSDVTEIKQLLLQLVNGKTNG